MIEALSTHDLGNRDPVNLMVNRAWLVCVTLICLQVVLVSQFNVSL